MIELAEWIERYRRAWEEANEEAVVELFTDEAVYRSHPFREPNVGRGAIRSYWRGATVHQSDVVVRFGAPIAEGPRVAVEWWTTMEDADGGPITLPGCLLLRFAPDGRCEELREYWHLEHGTHEAHPGWGE